MEGAWQSAACEDFCLLLLVKKVRLLRKLTFFITKKISFMACKYCMLDRKYFYTEKYI